MLSKKLKIAYQNQTTEIGSKHRFRLLQEKVFIQAVCLRALAVSVKYGYRLKGRAMGI